jgi:hypothetical protein
VESRVLAFETKRVQEAGPSGEAREETYARIYDEAGETVAAHAHPSWPAARPIEAMSAADLAARVALTSLVPQLADALAGASVPAAVAADKASLESLAATFKSHGEPPRAEAAGGIRPQGLVDLPGDVFNSYGFQYEIYKKGAFWSGNTLFDHSAMLVRNWVNTKFDGKWYVTSVYVQSGNAGAKADDPAMTRHCTSSFIANRWWVGSDALECPGTYYPVLYANFGVCNNSTELQRFQMHGYSGLVAGALACRPGAVPNPFAPDCW